MRKDLVWGICIGALLGILIGVGGYTFFYAKGASYLTNNPQACANCHVMQGHYDGWIKSSHRSVAVCNDCHMPSGFIAKYLTKASNGFWHSFAFTSGRYPDNINIKQHNLEVAEKACRKCHAEIVQAIEGPHQGRNQEPCLKCHLSVGHME